MGRLGRVLGVSSAPDASAVARFGALLRPGEHTIIKEEEDYRDLYRPLQTSRPLQIPLLKNADTLLSAFGPGADSKRSKAAYPPPRCVLDHKVNGSILASTQS